MEKKTVVERRETGESKHCLGRELRKPRETQSGVCRGKETGREPTERCLEVCRRQDGGSKQWFD